MAFQIEIIAGPHTGEQFRLPDSGTFVFGRSNKADYAFQQDDRMSSSHFRIECKSTELRIIDLRSTNGTFVEEKQIAEADINGETRMRAGATILVIRPVPVSPSTQGIDRRPSRDTIQPIANSQQLRRQLYERKIAEELNQRQKSEEAWARYPAPVGEQASARPIEVIPFNWPIAQGLVDADPVVRQAAIYAAAWRAPRTLLQHCRGLAAQPRAEDSDALMMLAILADPSDFECLMTIARCEVLGNKRFEMLAIYGNPQSIPWLIECMQGVAGAVQGTDRAAAADSFRQITGHEIPSKPADVQELHDDGAQAESETADVEPDVAIIPDHEFALQLWQRIKPQFSEGTRWRHGKNMAMVSLHDLPLLDRLHQCLRQNLAGQKNLSCVDLVRFPQGQSNCELSFLRPSS
jgi:hypothetical protein